MADILKQPWVWNNVLFFRITALDTYLFVNDLSTGAQDKIRRTFSDTPQKIEMPKKVSSTDGKKSKQSKSELNDEPERMNKTKEQTNLKGNPKEPNFYAWCVFYQGILKKI